LLIRNKLRALLQAYGTEKVKAFLWNTEFSRGRCDYLESTIGDLVYPYVEKYANHGSILDLGCGSGNTGNELDANAYADYTGVDISDVAIEKARVRTEENRRVDKNNYFQSNILSYLPTRQFDVILFRESIYYMPLRKIKPMLDRYSRYLKEGGVFIVRMARVSGRMQRIAGIVESDFQVVEKYLSDEPKAILMVFRRPCRLQPGHQPIFGATDHRDAGPS
jgi:2-polyprenyl-6-hydroxyphenyl methylase/3-demethylubiquinone-9 3-methyltransferase